MKTINRNPSQLLCRRSYKPGRRVAVTFRPARPCPVPIRFADLITHNSSGTEFALWNAVASGGLRENTG